MHAEKILKVWNKEYPDYPQHYARVIDNYTNYAQSLIDDLRIKEIAAGSRISVDIAGLQYRVIPEILNLVFFKRVMSRD